MTTSLMKGTKVRVIRALVLVTATVSLASCSSGKNTTTTTSSTAATTPSSPVMTTTAAGTGTALNVTESEFTITGAPKTLPAGTYTLTIKNTGKFPHNLTVNGPGVTDKASPTLTPGTTGDLTVTLQKGSYEFFCTVDSHKDKGMDLTVQVT